jgi:hypothetical protein
MFYPRFRRTCVVLGISLGLLISSTAPTDPARTVRLSLYGVAF